MVVHQVQGGVGLARMPDPIQLDLAVSQVHKFKALGLGN